MSGRNPSFLRIRKHLALQYMAMPLAWRQALRAARPLGVVWSWEVQRLLRLLSTRILLLVIALSFLYDFTILINYRPGIMFPVTDIYGMMMGIHNNIFVLLIPFFTVGLVSRDVKQRTQELLMSTATPTWAYIWGRYLAGLCLSSILLLFYLLMLVIRDFGCYFFLLKFSTYSASYPRPDLGLMSVLWITMTFLPVVLFSSLCFVLGTFWPTISGYVKLFTSCGCMFFWLGLFLGTFYLSWFQSWLPAFYLAWDPTSNTLFFAYDKLQLLSSVHGNPGLFVRASGDAALHQTLSQLWLWFLTHLFYAGLGLFLVALIGRHFKRFRNL